MCIFSYIYMGGVFMESKIICNINRDSDENKENMEQLKEILKTILGFKININYKINN